MFWVFNATRYVQTKTQNARTRQFQEEFGVYVSKKLTEHWSWEDWLWSVDIYKICTNKKYKRNRQMFDTPKMFSSNVFAIFIILQNLTANKWRFQRKCVKLSCVKKLWRKKIVNEYENSSKDWGQFTIVGKNQKSLVKTIKVKKSWEKQW